MTWNHARSFLIIYWYSIWFTSYDIPCFWMIVEVNLKMCLDSILSTNHQPVTVNNPITSHICFMNKKLIKKTGFKIYSRNKALFVVSAKYHMMNNKTLSTWTVVRLVYPQQVFPCSLWNFNRNDFIEDLAQYNKVLSFEMSTLLAKESIFLCWSIGCYSNSPKFFVRRVRFFLSSADRIEYTQFRFLSLSIHLIVAHSKKHQRSQSYAHKCKIILQGNRLQK